MGSVLVAPESDKACIFALFMAVGILYDCIGDKLVTAEASKMIMLLLKAGAEVDRTMSRDGSASSNLLRRTPVEVVEKLIELGPPEESRTNIQECRKEGENGKEKEEQGGSDSAEDTES